MCLSILCKLRKKKLGKNQHEMEGSRSCERNGPEVTVLKFKEESNNKNDDKKKKKKRRRTTTLNFLGYLHNSDLSLIQIST
jgi:hypothetical protein